MTHSENSLKHLCFLQSIKFSFYRNYILFLGPKHGGNRCNYNIKALQLQGRFMNREMLLSLKQHYKSNLLSINILELPLSNDLIPQALCDYDGGRASVNLRCVSGHF